MYVFTSESVSAGHPDKVADQISDAILDNFLAFDKNARVACETVVTTGQVFIVGEVSSKIYVDIPKVVRETVKKIGYDKSEYRFDGNSCGILSAIHEQSADIAMGVDGGKEQGAGDQGMMFGYAVKEADNLMPMPIALAHDIMKRIKAVRHANPHILPFLRPDGKCQVTVRYSDDGKPLSVDTVVVSLQHDKFTKGKDGVTTLAVDSGYVRECVKNEIMVPFFENGSNKTYRELFHDSNYKLIVNPAGQFVTGGPDGDAGLTGRKIVVDAYGGRGAQGGGCQSGKDPSKVDRSAFYMARYVAKNMVAAGVADEMLVQVSYAIGMAEPVSVYVNTYGRSNVPLTDGQIADMIHSMFDFKPRSIESFLKLRSPMYFETASFGQVGQEYRVVEKEFTNSEGAKLNMTVELFTWEKLDSVEMIKEAFKKYM